MAVTAENSARNLVTARRNAGAAIGLVGFDGSRDATANLPYEDLRRLNVAVAQIIVAHPASFVPDRVTTAKQILLSPDGPLTDSDFSLSQFGDELAEEAKITLPSVGNKLLWAALALGVVYIAFQTSPKWLPLLTGRKSSA